MEHFRHVIFSLSLGFTQKIYYSNMVLLKLVQQIMLANLMAIVLDICVVAQLSEW